jgi:N-acetylmuramoyl-L-alanine amidase
MRSCADRHRLLARSGVRVGLTSAAPRSLDAPKRWRAVTALLAVMLVPGLLRDGRPTASAAPASAPATAYHHALQRETMIRAEFGRATTSEAQGLLLTRVRSLIDEYEHLSKQYPTSGYSDNALWQGAMLAADAYGQFRHASDRKTARRLLDALGARFPSSSLNARTAGVRTKLDAAPTPAPAPEVTAALTPTSSSTSHTIGTSTPASAGRPLLTAIQREVLTDAVRVTLLLDREATFSSQRLDGPSRLAIDLRNARVEQTLKNARLTFTTDVVRLVRVTPGASSGTRVLIDLDRAGRYSVYPVYDPYRLIIDVERGGVRAPPPLRATAGTTRAPQPSRSVAAAVASQTETRAATAASDRIDPQGDTGRQLATAPTTGRANDLARRSATTSPPSHASYSLSRQLGLGAVRIVIDPGHGGHDPGAQVPGLDESALVLDVALRLEQRLLKIPNVEVVMTRRTSEYIPLEERTAIANRASADLFLSIHANASPNPEAHGIETYFLNFAPNADAEAIAARENAGSGKTMRNLSDIVRAITLNDKLDESRDFALRIQSAMYAKLRPAHQQTKSLGVKQAPFQVLIGATMPSVLAEISFMTNEQEGALLKSDTYRDEIAAALFDGVIGYQRALATSKQVGGKATKAAD